MGKEMGLPLSKDGEHGEDIVLGLPRQRPRCLGVRLFWGQGPLPKPASHSSWGFVVQFSPPELSLSIRKYPSSLVSDK